jgi:hypothetical protein
MILARGIPLSGPLIQAIAWIWACVLRLLVGVGDAPEPDHEPDHHLRHRHHDPRAAEPLHRYLQPPVRQKSSILTDMIWRGLH